MPKADPPSPERARGPARAARHDRAPRPRAALLLAALVLAGTAVATRAPAALDQWQSIGPYGATIITVAIDPSDPDRQAAGGFAGLFRSTDGGASWQRADADLPDNDIGAVVFTTDGTLYTGTFASGVYRSTDGGASFTPANAGIENTTIFALHADGARLWAGTVTSGVFLSTDGGGSWMARSSGLEGQQVNDLLSAGGDSLLAATGSTGIPGGIFRSTDAGLSWLPSSTGLTNFEVVTLARRPDAAVIYAGTIRSQTVGGVYRSTDSGQSWALSVQGLTNTNVADLLVDPDQPALVYAATQPLGGFTQSGVYRSTDDGARWELAPGSPAVNDVRALARRADGGGLLAGVAGQTSLRGGVYRSSDGLDWMRSDRGMTVLRCRALATTLFDPDEILVGTIGSFREPSGAYRSTDLGQSWEEHTSGGMPPSIYSLAISAQTVGRRYAGTSSGVYRWNGTLLAWQATALVNVRVLDLLLAGDGGGGEAIWAATNAGLFRSTDQGGSWEDRTANLGSTSLSAVTVDPAAPDVVYAGTDSGGVFRSTDGGGDWQAANVELGSFNIRDLAFDETGQLLAATDAGVYALDGASWIDVSSGLANLDARALAIYRGERFVATAGGVYRSSTNPPAPWQAASDGLANLDVISVHADTAGSFLRLFAGTEGGGVFAASEVVPVVITHFESVAAPGRVVLRFRTGFERDHLGFRIERRLDGERTFSERTHSLLTGGPDYRFTDLDPALRPGRVAEYRLAALDRRGGIEHHGPYRVAVPGTAAAAARPRLVAAPNPFAASTRIQLAGAGGRLRIIGASGRVLRSERLPVGLEQWSWDGRDAGGRRLPAGVYWLRIETPGGGTASVRVVRLGAR